MTPGLAVHGGLEGGYCKQTPACLCQQKHEPWVHTELELVKEIQPIWREGNTAIGSLPEGGQNCRQHAAFKLE